MHTTTSLSSSWLGSSPSRNSPSRSSVRTPGRDVARRSTLERDPLDSPSRQMLLDFSQMLVRSDQEFNARLDSAAAVHTRRNSEQLSQAALDHERVRQGAQLEINRLIREQELQRQRREDQQRQELERLDREKARQEAEIRQRQVEAKQREEETARREAQHKRQIEEAESRRKAQQEQEAAAQRLKAQQESERKAREAAAAAEQVRAAQQTPQAPQRPAAPAAPAAIPSAAITRPFPARQAPGAYDPEEIHNRYLTLHKRMKDFWKPFKQQSAAKGNPLKAAVGDMRREMRTAMGQISVKREDSKIVITKLRQILRAAQSAGGPTIDIRPFIISRPLPTMSNDAEAQYPAILFYAFICFVKFALKQFEQEAALEDGRVIAELGTVAASLMVDKEFVWKGIPLIDLLLAKYHRVCPILFGITGDMRSSAGQARLGWIPISGAPPTVSTYSQRMTGLACGFATMSLRVVASPVLPASEYWRAISAICNTPPQQLTGGHFMVLKGLTRDWAKKFISIYGAQAKAVLRKATIGLPSRAPSQLAEAVNIVSSLPDAWRKAEVYIE
ncbi:hypothetical protein K491DRAFT_587364 [Lophiostoma macrostomum CBS 122681]|uniref:mRNA export factor GLE1 n=1 Tax=Lophiostoma macrostomum CBS 122681 TaxID=1314788 RepID=A0A6A6TMR9_9PLEO|nr:hypothetical protein K491DRAFT_587364 [Lophiostoma macrostomum CBS 122681]